MLNSTDTLVLGFPEYAAPARRLAAALNLPYDEIHLHHFPDGESMVRLPARMPDRLILCRSLDHPNDKLIELMLVTETARTAGVKHITLVAPYLCYMRQDAAFHPGEAVSQRIIGRWLSDLFDTVITVDPHLHRVQQLSEVLHAKLAVTLSAGPLIATYLQNHLGQALLVGPDSESRQWVAQIASLAKMEYLIAEKQRFSDREVLIHLPTHDIIHGRTVVIVDDVASTAHTLATAARLLRDAGATAIHCCVTHGLFLGQAEEILRKAGISRVLSTDSVLHHTNAIELAGILATALQS